MSITAAWFDPAEMYETGFGIGIWVGSLTASPELYFPHPYNKPSQQLMFDCKAKY